jgi:hypothetical protein
VIADINKNQFWGERVQKKAKNGFDLHLMPCSTKRCMIRKCFVQTEIEKGCSYIIQIK